jgi:hypothetical protein
MPTVAAVEAAVGGGLAIAAACDFRLATPDARFGAPIARTLGNCLSARGYARLALALGIARAKRLLLLGEMIGAEEAKAAGFVHDVVPPEALDAAVDALAASLAGNAPLTQEASRSAAPAGEANLPPIDDLIGGSTAARISAAACALPRQCRRCGPEMIYQLARIERETRRCPPCRCRLRLRAAGDRRLDDRQVDAVAFSRPPQRLKVRRAGGRSPAAQSSPASADRCAANGAVGSPPASARNNSAGSCRSSRPAPARRHQRWQRRRSPG